jgi:hypothetical protein
MAGFGFGAVAWILAWTRFEWFKPLQPFTFTPHWVAYIVVVNALTVRRTGGCMITKRPGYFFLLFPASACFWWFFEYLNRFVQNWYYVGVARFTPLEYFVFATLPFSTVLPAVLGTFAFLDSFDGLGAGLRRFKAVRLRGPRLAAWLILVASAAGLAGIGVWPNALFPLLWISPLLVLSSLQALTGHRTVFAKIGRGQWRRVALLGLAALVCGVFWEMWNFYSLAKWRYSVPYVGRFRVFEMPILGYAGYLPFGLECGAVGEILASLFRRRPARPAVSDGLRKSTALPGQG